MTDPTQNHFKRLVSRGLSLAVCGLGLWFMAVVFARVWWVFELGSHFMLPYLACAAFLQLLCLWMRRWKLALVTAMMLVWCAAQVVPYLIRGEVERPGVRPTYRLLLLNLLQSNREIAAVTSYIEAESPDVLLLQEVTPWWEKRLRPVLGESYPFEVVEDRDSPFGMWLLSKHPLGRVAVLPSEGAKNPYIVAQIDLAGHQLGFVAVHPRAPTGQSKARARDARLEEVGDVLAANGGARLLLGDLNCSPWSPVFRRLVRDAKLRDSGRWRGWSPTWNRGISWLSIPIDHCLISEEIGVARREVGPDVGSDHRGVAVDIFFREAHSAGSGTRPILKY